MKFDADVRAAMLQRLQQERFDMVIVGGGITGAGILVEAALRGLKVALIEKGDFAHGTSSRSSKLVHGGLRYLEQYAFGLVFESTQERSRLMRLGSHLIRPLPFLMPVFGNSPHSLWFINAGLWLYDVLGTFRNYRMHRRLGRANLLEREPTLRPEGLKGGLLYYDAVTDDARLTLENILSGYRAGGVPLSRMQAVGLTLKNGRVSAIEVQDQLSEQRFAVQTGCVVVAAGPWTETVMQRLGCPTQGPYLRPTKGIHVVLPHSVLPLSHAVVLSSPSDHRMMFAIPWKGATIVGTTDTDWNGDPDAVFATRADVQYVLEAVRHHFPALTVRDTDVIGTWAGLRPLIREEGVAESKTSREEQVTVSPGGVVAIAGGKLTTYRLMAVEAVHAARRFLPSGFGGSSGTQHQLLFYEGGTPTEEGRNQALSALEDGMGLSREVAAHLLNIYGGSVHEILGRAAGDPSLMSPIHPALPYLRVEVLYAVENEMALTLEDFMVRRTPIFFLLPDQGWSVARDVAELMASRLGWSKTRVQQEIDALARLAKAHMDCLSAGSQAGGAV